MFLAPLPLFLSSPPFLPPSPPWFARSFRSRRIFHFPASLPPSLGLPIFMRGSSGRHGVSELKSEQRRDDTAGQRKRGVTTRVDVYFVCIVRVLFQIKRLFSRVPRMYVHRHPARYPLPLIRPPSCRGFVTLFVLSDRLAGKVSKLHQ